MTTHAAYIDLDEGSAPSTPAANKVRIYAKADGLPYAKDDAGTESGLVGAGSAAPVGSKIVRTAADYTTTSATLVDVDAANLTITVTTLARRVMVGLSATGANSNATGRCDVAIKIDGSVPNGATHQISQHSETGNFMNLSFVFLTDVLSAGSHSFVLQFARGAAGTFTLNANSTNPLCLWVAETMIVA